jgi:hypothetical protein
VNNNNINLGEEGSGGSKDPLINNLVVFNIFFILEKSELFRKPNI